VKRGQSDAAKIMPTIFLIMYITLRKKPDNVFLCSETIKLSQISKHFLPTDKFLRISNW
jgi:hypothetical protein